VNPEKGKMTRMGYLWIGARGRRRTHSRIAMAASIMMMLAACLHPLRDRDSVTARRMLRRVSMSSCCAAAARARDPHAFRECLVHDVQRRRSSPAISNDGTSHGAGGGARQLGADADARAAAEDPLGLKRRAASPSLFRFGVAACGAAALMCVVKSA
jgi:hypothetical protein